MMGAPNDNTRSRLNPHTERLSNPRDLRNADLDPALLEQPVFELSQRLLRVFLDPMFENYTVFERQPPRRAASLFDSVRMTIGPALPKQLIAECLAELEYACQVTKRTGLSVIGRQEESSDVIRNWRFSPPHAATLHETDGLRSCILGIQKRL
jgi:hypothetical protein